MYKIASSNFQQNRCAFIIQKLIEATFSKGHPNFGISLFSICLSIFKAVSRWNRHDTEYLTEKDDALYKLQNTDQLLSCTYLLRQVQVEHLQVSMNFLEDNYGF